MSRRADALTYYVSDSDIRALQRIMGVTEVIPREPPPKPKFDPLLAYAMRITANCPCENCLQRRTCAEECRVFTAWVRVTDRGRRYAAPATG